MNLGRLNRYESMISELHADGSDISLRAAGLIESMGIAPNPSPSTVTGGAL